MIVASTSVPVFTVTARASSCAVTALNMASGGQAGSPLAAG
jgi:hypothetical protein